MKAKTTIEQHLTEHSNFLMDTSDEFDIPLTRMFSDAEFVYFAEGDDEESRMTNADAYEAVGFIKCASMHMDEKPAKIVRKYADPDPTPDVIKLPTRRARQRK